MGVQSVWRIGKVGEPGNGLLDPLSRDRRYGTLLHNQFVAVQITSNRSCDSFNLAEIGFTAIFLRSADANKQDRGCAHGILHVVGKCESATRQAAGKQIVQTRLVERRSPR